MPQRLKKYNFCIQIRIFNKNVENFLRTPPAQDLPIGILRYRAHFKNWMVGWKTFYKCLLLPILLVAGGAGFPRFSPVRIRSHSWPVCLGLPNVNLTSDSVHVYPTLFVYFRPLKLWAGKTKLKGPFGPVCSLLRSGRLRLFLLVEFIKIRLRRHCLTPSTVWCRSVRRSPTWAARCRHVLRISFRTDHRPRHILRTTEALYYRTRWHRCRSLRAPNRRFCKNIP